MGANLDNADRSCREVSALMALAKREGGPQALGELRGSVSLHLATQPAQLRCRTPLAAMRRARESFLSWLNSLDRRITVRARAHAFNHRDGESPRLS